MITLKIYKDGCTLWYRSIWLHRLNGPAAIYSDGFTCWYKNGYKHRLNGPAVISKKGKVEYWIKGKPVTEYEMMFFEPIL